MTESLVLRGAVGLWTGDPEAPRSVGDLRIKAGRIEAVGVVEPQPGDRILDVAGCVVAPGLINTHHHLFQSVLKAVPAGLNAPLFEWLRTVPYTYWHRLDEEAMVVAAELGMVELLLSGCTTIADHHYLYGADLGFDPDSILFDTAERLGVRFVLARGVTTKGRTFDTDDRIPMPIQTLDEAIAGIEASIGRHHDPAPDSLRRIAVAPTTPTFSVEPGELRALAAFARSHGLRLHSHLSETGGYDAFTEGTYGKRPVAWVAEQDWVGEDVWFAHLVTCDADELSILAQTKTGMAHCPQANARLGSGTAPADALHALGGRVSLAVDGAAANEAADMATALYSALCVHRAAKGPGAVRPEHLMQWATSGGAEILGLPKVGRLKPGMSADIAVFDLNQPRWWGQHDPMAGLFISAGSMVPRHLFVAGRPVVENGRIPGLDLAELRERSGRVVRRLVQG